MNAFFDRHKLCINGRHKLCLTYRFINEKNVWKVLACHRKCVM